MADKTNIDTETVRKILQTDLQIGKNCLNHAMNLVKLSFNVSRSNLVTKHLVAKSPKYRFAWLT